MQFLITLFVALTCPFAYSFQQDGTVADKFDSWLHQGFENHQNNEYSAAIPLLRNAWKLRPHDYYANLLLGIDLLRTGQTKESITFLAEAARQKPEEEFAYEYLGEAYAALDHQAEAFESFKKAIDVAPDSSEAKTSFVGFCLVAFCGALGSNEGF